MYSQTRYINTTMYDCYDPKTNASAICFSVASVFFMAKLAFLFDYTIFIYFFGYVKDSPGDRPSLHNKVI